MSCLQVLIPRNELLASCWLRPCCALLARPSRLVARVARRGAWAVCVQSLAPDKAGAAGLLHLERAGRARAAHAHGLHGGRGVEVLDSGRHGCPRPWAAFERLAQEGLVQSLGLVQPVLRGTAGCMAGEPREESQAGVDGGIAALGPAGWWRVACYDAVAALRVASARAAVGEGGMEGRVQPGPALRCWCRAKWPQGVPGAAQGGRVAGACSSGTWEGRAEALEALQRPRGRQRTAAC